MASQGLQRARVREHYAIKGGCCGDYCGAAFCHPCVMSQMGEEIKDEEKARQGLA
jgi:Cys-rich protein (TIGR01571 family)